MLKAEGAPLLDKSEPARARPRASAPPQLSLKQKMRRKERRAEAERQAQQRSPLLCNSPQSSPEDEFGTCITGEEIRKITSEGGRVLESAGDSPSLRSPASPRGSKRRDALGAAGSGVGLMTKTKETEEQRYSRIGRSDLTYTRNQQRPAATLTKSMNKSRLTRYMEAKHGKQGLTGESFNLHDVGVNPRGRAPGVEQFDIQSSPTLLPDHDYHQPNTLTGAEKNARMTRRMARQLEEAKNQGGSREAAIYGIIALLCLFSGRLDPTAIVMRILVMGVCALVMRSLGYIKF